MSNNKIFSLMMIISLFYFGCKIDDNIIIKKYTITSPKSDWKYYNNIKILLAINIDTQEITWESSVDGFLGKGNHLLVFLTEGNHKITADVLGTKNCIDVQIYSKNTSLGEEIKTLLNYSPVQRIYPNGTYNSYLINLNGSITGFKKDNNIQKMNINNKMIFNNRDFFIQRDLHINISGKLALLPNNKARVLSTNNLKSTPGDIRTFFVPNTSSQYIQPHEIVSELFYSSEKLNVWIPYYEDIDKNLLLECILAIEKNILWKIDQIWGISADIDNDGHFAILISKTINNEKLAIGFFNPSDFYKRETNITSDYYNPNSNEMDIVYIAAPDNNSTSYNKESIIATIVHEITHAITYTNKVWKKEIAGQKNTNREELFLDEGLSHLSEVLCGCGYSGGTVKYIQRYFEDTSSYSFFFFFIFGQNDSIGMRGAITLFLSWLFWEKGGFDYIDSNSYMINDYGGIHFLKNLVNSDGIGWDNIGKIAETNTDILFQEMAKKINNSRIDKNQNKYKIDIISGEPIELFPGISFNEIIIDFPTLYNIYQPINIERWSLVFFEPFILDNSNIITFFSTYQTGISYLISTYSP